MFHCIAIVTLAFGVEDSVPRALGIPNHSALVEALVDSTVTVVDRKSQKNPVTEATARIVRVFVGDADLTGREITLLSMEQLPQGNGREITPQLVLKERLLCWVDSRQNSLKVSLQELRGDLFWPVRERVHSYFDSAYALSQTMERYCGASTEAATNRILLEAMHASDSYVAAWAVPRLLARSEKSGDRSRFLSAASRYPEMAPGGQMAVDEALLHLDDAWQHSEARFKMFAALLSAELQKDEARWVLDRLGVAIPDIATDGFDIDTYLELVAVALRNDDLPVESRGNIITKMRRLRRLADQDVSSAFAMLVGVATSTEDVAIRREAARTLAYAFPLDEERRAIIEDIVNDEQDTTVVRYLNAALSGSADRN